MSKALFQFNGNTMTVVLPYKDFIGKKIVDVDVLKDSDGETLIFSLEDGKQIEIIRLDEDNKIFVDTD